MLELASECLIMMDEHIDFVEETKDEEKDDDQHHFNSIRLFTCPAACLCLGREILWAVLIEFYPGLAWLLVQQF